MLLPAYRCVTPATGKWVGDGDVSEVYTSADGGRTWQATPVPDSTGCVHMSIVPTAEGYAGFFRSRWADSIYVSRSADGTAWSAPEPTVGTLATLQPAERREMWRLHVEAAVELMQRLAPALPDGGRVVLIGSRVASGAPGRSQYAASKAAMVGLARSWAAELAPRGITVNVVAPGATDTPMLRDPARSAVAPRLPPLGRFVRPEEVAGLVAFLLSEDGGSTTGQQLVVCGGASL